MLLCMPAGKPCGGSLQDKMQNYKLLTYLQKNLNGKGEKMADR